MFLSTPTLAVASGYTDLNTGIAAENEGRHDEAITYLSAAISSPDLPANLQSVAYIDRARAYGFTKRYADAAKDCDAALRLKSDWFEAFEICGTERYNAGDRAGAVADFSSGIAVRPSFPRAYLVRAFAYASMEKYSDAIADDNKVIALEPEDRDAYVSRASNYDLEARFDLALADWTAMDSKAGNADISRAIGIDQWALGNYPEAASALARAQKLAPESLYLQIWVDIVAAEQKPTGGAVELSASPATFETWPGPLLRFYAGESKAADVLAAAAAVESPEKKKGQLCEADFYVGEWLMLHSAADRGKPYFINAEKNCPHAFIEYVAAGVELRRLDEKH